MRNPLSDKIVQIPPSGIRKFFDIVSEMSDAISLGVGEPDFDTPWHIREEGIYSLEKGRTFYTSNAGLRPLKVEICEYLKRRCDVLYDPDHEVLVTVGGSEAIDIGLRAMLNPGDEVLIPQPSYVSYMPCVVLADGVPVVIELEEKDQFKLTHRRITSEDVQGVSLLFVGQILDAGKGNLLICNWHGHTKDATVDEPQLIEVDTNGKVLWSLNDKKNIGKVSAACLVSNPKFKINVVE